jgi:hypothetical protein
VLHSDVVPATEAVFVITPKLSRHIGMTKLIPIVDVGAATVFNILARSLDAILEATPLPLAVLLWRGIPSALSIARTLSITSARRRTILRKRASSGET